MNDDITKRAVREASPLTGWHPYPVFCNRHLVGSMPTKEMQQSFIAAQTARHPLSNYGALPVSA